MQRSSSWHKVLRPICSAGGTLNCNGSEAHSCKRGGGGVPWVTFPTYLSLLRSAKVADVFCLLRVIWVPFTVLQLFSLVFGVPVCPFMSPLILLIFGCLIFTYLFCFVYSCTKLICDKYVYQCICCASFLAYIFNYYNYGHPPSLAF